MTEGVDAGIPGAAVLTAFVDAAVNGESSLPERMRAVADDLSSDALVDAAAVVANFERMNRIADGAGIELDAPVAALSAGIQDDLDLRSFSTAANSRTAGPLGRGIGKIAAAVLPRLLKLMRG